MTRTTIALAVMAALALPTAFAQAPAAPKAAPAAKVAEGKIVLKYNHTLDEVVGNDSGVTGVKIKSTTDGTVPQMFFSPSEAFSSAISPIVEDGVIG